MKSYKEGTEIAPLKCETETVSRSLVDTTNWLQACEELGFFEPTFVQRIVNRMERYTRLH